MKTLIWTGSIGVAIFLFVFYFGLFRMAKVSENEEVWKTPAEGETSIQLFWTVLFILIGTGVFYRYLCTPGFHFADLGGWAWNHCIPLLVVAGAVFGVIKANAEYLGKVAAILETAIIAAVVGIFVAFPLISGMVIAFFR